MAAITDTYALHSLAAAGKPGSTISIPPGAYPEQKIALNPTAMVTLKGGPGVTVNGIGIDKSSNITLDGLEVTAAVRTGLAISVSGGSHDIALNNLNIHSATPGLSGVTLRDGSNLSLTNCEIHDVGSAVQHLNVQGLTITGNAIHDINGDGIKGGGSSFVTISGNDFTNLITKPGDHPDAIQFWTTGTTAPTTDIAITNNTYTRGTGNISQGIFLGNELNIRYQRVTITGNATLGAMYAGIAVYECDGLTITGNFVQGWPDMGSAIHVEGVTNATVTGNTASTFQYTGTNTSLTNSPNTTIPLSKQGDTSALTAWQKVAAPPIVAPPAVNPLQAQLDAANASIATLKAANVALQGQLTATQTALVANQAILANISKLAAGA